MEAECRCATVKLLQIYQVTGRARSEALLRVHVHIMISYCITVVMFAGIQDVTWHYHDNGNTMSCMFNLVEN